MKPLLRCFFMVLIFVMLVGVVSFFIMLQRAVAPTPAQEQPSYDPAHLNATLLRLAAFDPSEELLHQRVEAVLDGRLPAFAIRAGQHHISSLRSWHHLNHYDPSIICRLTSQLSITRRIPSCAVVGNSGILLQANHGAHIDSHAAVFRINNAGILAYAAHVGTKTNFSVINRFTLRKCAHGRFGCFCHLYGPHVHVLLYTSQPEHFLDVAACNATRSTYQLSSISVIDPRLNVLCERIAKYYSLRRFVTETGRAPEEWDSAYNATLFRNSSGMQAIMVAVGVCDRVSVFGFGKSSDAKHHYHDNQKNETAKHDYESEYAFYLDLSERPQVVPFLMDSRFTVPPVAIYH